MYDDGYKQHLPKHKEKLQPFFKTAVFYKTHFLQRTLFQRLYADCRVFARLSGAVLY